MNEMNLGCISIFAYFYSKFNEQMIWIIVILLACVVGLMLVGGILYFAWELLCFIFSVIASWIFPDEDW